MIESILCGLQLVVTGLTTTAAGFMAAKTKKRVFLLMALSFGVYFLGDLYWQLYLVFYQQTPHFSEISYLSWYAGYLFLLLALLELRGERPKTPRRRLLWFLPAFAVGMCVFYLQWGDWISNIVSALLMSLLLWHGADCLILWRGPAFSRRRRFAWTIIAFCCMEYASWTASCFWMGDTLANPYLWFDFLLTVCLLLLAITVKGAAEE